MYSKFFALFAVASLGLASTVHAQQSEQAVAAPKMIAQQPLSITAAEMTRGMSTRLKLNEGQYIKLYEINKTRVNQMAQIERDFKNDPGARSTKMSELDAQYQQECSRVLTPSQLSQLNDGKATPASSGNGVG